jgi:hypothetical protein
MISVDLMAPDAFWARIVTIDEAMLNAKNGTFSIRTVLKILEDVILSKGYQSNIKRIKGRLTAIGLLMRARIKKQRAER